jgi:hypothetical protein
MDNLDMGLVARVLASKEFRPLAKRILANNARLVIRFADGSEVDITSYLQPGDRDA